MYWLLSYTAVSLPGLTGIELRLVKTFKMTADSIDSQSINSWPSIYKSPQYRESRDIYRGMAINRFIHNIIYY